MICKDCGRDLPPDAFHSAGRRDKLGNIVRRRDCAKCNTRKVAASRKAAYATDPAPFKEAAKRWRRLYPERKRAQVLRQYGLTLEQERAMLVEQGGACAICRREYRDKGGRRMHVDHCHRTGQVRGILCTKCNLGLGKFDDSPARLRAAAVYLEEKGATP